jgi:aminoglycoside phosphotransferase (APT) family kinase protein
LNTKIPPAPFLETVSRELANVLQTDDIQAIHQTAHYGRRVINSLLARQREYPRLAADALKQYDLVLGELSGALMSRRGGINLVADLLLHIRQEPDYGKAESAMQRAVETLYSQPGDDIDTLMQKISGISCEFHNSLQSAISHEAPLEESRRTLTFDSNQVSRLQQYFRETLDPGATIDRVKPVSGGASKETIMVELKPSQTLPDALVLRVDWAAGVVQSSVVDEHLILQLAQEGNVPAPRPLALEKTGEILGAPFLVVNAVPGKTMGDWTEVTDPSPAFARDLARAFARLHQIPVARAAGQLPGAECTTSEKILSDLDYFEASWHASGWASVGMAQAYGWLRQHIRFSEGQRSIIHCDPGLHNILGHEGRLSAILDWETAAVGNPAQDLCYLRKRVDSIIPWDEFLAEYEAEGGTIPSSEELDFYELWRGVFCMHFNAMCRSVFLSGQANSLVHAYVSHGVYEYYYQDLHQTLHNLLSRPSASA